MIDNVIITYAGETLMRELSLEEAHTIQGGFVITATVATLIVSGVVAALYFSNNLLSLYIYTKTGSMPAQPSGGEISQMGNEIKIIAAAIGH